MVLVCTPVQARNIESVLAPGDLIQGHAKWEDDCTQCHVKFDRSAQDARCMECHKDVAQDLRAKTGFHGRGKPQACRTCHTEHKGRNAQIVVLDPTQFDHSATDLPLRGKHRVVACTKCHEPAKKYAQAPQECNACHKKDDAHKGALGVQCANCHTEKKWNEAKFDHDKTRMPLIGAHAEIKCTECHKDTQYKSTPRTCIGCHKKDDDKKGHQGQFGEKCESCHGTKLWKSTQFNHTADTGFELRGKHSAVKCTTCHTGNLYKIKTPQACIDCHKKDDKHKETLGRECGNCHTERGWKEKTKFDHDKTSFPLLGKHASAECKTCHKTQLFKEAPKTCVGCHEKDDRHERTLGDKCGDCHFEGNWKNTKGRFDHERTRFPLRNAHAATSIQCSACHKDLRSLHKTALDCASCHLKDDKHAGQLGRQCESCHTDKAWKVAAFDHARTRFALTGRHLAAACKDCHATPRYKDTQRECSACHAKQDKHKLKFGAACESCHNTRAWVISNFDHNKRSTYKLDGAHRKVACESCHTRPAPAGQHVAPIGNACVSCHAADDPHDGHFGTRCEQCHLNESWKKVNVRTGRAVEKDSVAHVAGTGGWLQ